MQTYIFRNEWRLRPVNAIKTVKDLTGCGLRQAKNFVDCFRNDDENTTYRFDTIQVAIGTQIGEEAKRYSNDIVSKMFCTEQTTDIVYEPSFTTVGSMLRALYEDYQKAGDYYNASRVQMMLDFSTDAIDSHIVVTSGAYA